MLFFFRWLTGGKIRQVVFCGISVGILILVYKALMDMFYVRESVDYVDKLEQVENTNILFGLDKGSKEKRILNLQGWIAYEEIEYGELYVIFKEYGEDGEIIIPVNKMNKKKDDYLEKYNFIKREFSISLERNDLDLNKCYELYLCLVEKDGRGKSLDNILSSWKLATNSYVYQGELFDYNPTLYNEPVFYDETLKLIIENGELCYHQPEFDLWIYEYDKELYWIVGSNLFFTEGVDSCVRCYFNTLEIEALPDEMQRYGFDNMDFIFENNEIPVNTNEYRITSCELPDGYVVTYVTVGAYDSLLAQWIWRANIPLMY